MLVSCFISHFMSLSTTGLILLNLISTFLHHLMKRRVIGSVLLTTKVTVSPGGSSLRILKRSSFILAFAVPSELQQTSILHHLQGRGPHFLFPFLILNNLHILCHLIPLMNQHPILSNLSTVSLVKMKIIQSTWPTLTFPIFLADSFFYHLRIIGSATWPKSLTLMTMDNLLIQFPPEMDENWVRYGLARLGQISELPNWQRMLFCAYTTQLLHSTGEVCWNNKDSYFIWFEFVC